MTIYADDLQIIRLACREYPSDAPTDYQPISRADYSGAFDGFNVISDAALLYGEGRDVIKI